jgi:hypothetical protein
MGSNRLLRWVKTHAAQYGEWSNGQCQSCNDLSDQSHVESEFHVISRCARYAPIRTAFVDKIRRMNLMHMNMSNLAQRVQQDFMHVCFASES